MTTPHTSPNTPSISPRVILAVSGGIDSMVLLDLTAKYFAEHKIPLSNLIVASVDHGTRPSSADDLAFVARQCEEYGVTLRATALTLGPSPSESTARAARLKFFSDLQQEFNHAPIWTAHHLDDLVETVAINLIRGTGWRGLTPLNDSDRRHPFLDGTFSGQIFSRRDILRYAATHEIKYRQDPTNYEETYLRNRIRAKIQHLPDSQKRKILPLYQSQIELRAILESEAAEIIPATTNYPRQLFQTTDEKVALELLHELLNRRHHLSQTRPQLQRVHEAIKTYATAKKFVLNADAYLEFSRSYFTIKTNPTKTPK